MRRRRGAVLVALAVACGGLAASRVQDRERQLDARIGPLVPVVVARSDLRSGTALRVERLEVRRVPARFAPPDALASPDEAAGAPLAVPLAAGAYVTTAALARGREGGEPGGPVPRSGERALDVAVATGADLAGAAPGARVDVLITTEASEGRGRSYLALEDVELLGVRPAAEGVAANGSSAGAAARAGAVATLRVTVREAVLLTAAQSFAREIRLLVRPPGERRAGRAVAVDAGAL
jgi:pilus assembly protein CpaB